MKAIIRFRWVLGLIIVGLGAMAVVYYVEMAINSNLRQREKSRQVLVSQARAQALYYAKMGNPWIILERLGQDSFQPVLVEGPTGERMELAPGRFELIGDGGSQEELSLSKPGDRLILTLRRPLPNYGDKTIYFTVRRERQKQERK